MNFHEGIFAAIENNDGRYSEKYFLLYNEKVNKGKLRGLGNLRNGC